MRHLLNKIAILFFAGLGIHKVIFDILNLFEINDFPSKESGYSAVGSFIIFYVLIVVFSKKNKNIKSN